MLAYRNPGRRVEAVATVLVDRAIGLYALFLVITCSIATAGFWRTEVTSVQMLCRVVLFLFVLGTVGLVAAIWPGSWEESLSRTLCRTPFVGRRLADLVRALRLYRFDAGAIAGSILLSVVVHLTFAIGVYFISKGLYQSCHPLTTQLVIAPLSSVANIVPITVGPFEAVLDLLYTLVPLRDGTRLAAGQGLVVALCYRAICLVLATVGMIYRHSSRTELGELMRNPKDMAGADMSFCAVDETAQRGQRP